MNFKPSYYTWSVCVSNFKNSETRFYYKIDPKSKVLKSRILKFSPSFHSNFVLFYYWLHLEFSFFVTTYVCRELENLQLNID